MANLKIARDDKNISISGIITSDGTVVNKPLSEASVKSGDEIGIRLDVFTPTMEQISDVQRQIAAEEIREACDGALLAIGVTPGIRSGMVVKAMEQYSSSQLLMLVINHKDGVLCGSVVYPVDFASSLSVHRLERECMLRFYECTPEQVVLVPGRTGLEGLILAYALDEDIRALHALIAEAQANGAPPGFMQELIAICIEQWMKNVHKEDGKEHLDAVKSYAEMIRYAEEANAVARLCDRYPLEVRLACLSRVTDVEVIKMFLKETHSNHWAHMHADRGEEVIDWCVGVVNRAFDLGQLQLVEDARALDYMVRGFEGQETERKIAIQARLVELEAQQE